MFKHSPEHTNNTNIQLFRQSWLTVSLQQDSYANVGKFVDTLPLWEPKHKQWTINSALDHWRFTSEKSILFIIQFLDN